MIYVSLYLPYDIEVIPLPRPTIKIPDDGELEKHLGVNYSLSARVLYVKELLRKVENIDRAFDSLEGVIADLTKREEGYKTELRALHEKIGSLGPSERAAAERAYSMRGQIDRAQGEITRLEAELDRSQQIARDAVRRAREALKKPDSVGKKRG